MVTISFEPQVRCRVLVRQSDGYSGGMGFQSFPAEAPPSKKPSHTHHLVRTKCLYIQCHQSLPQSYDVGVLLVSQFRDEGGKLKEVKQMF